jgi:hypothetical protein
VHQASAYPFAVQQVAGFVGEHGLQFPAVEMGHGQQSDRQAQAAPPEPVPSAAERPGIGSRLNPYAVQASHARTAHNFIDQSSQFRLRCRGDRRAGVAELVVTTTRTQIGVTDQVRGEHRDHPVQVPEDRANPCDKRCQQRYRQVRQKQPEAGRPACDHSRHPCNSHHAGHSDRVRASPRINRQQTLER